MSKFICPLCGKFASVRLYDPEGFENDIKLVQVHGKGRGKGTERAWTVSIFEDEDAPIFLKIRDRMLTLYLLFYGDEEEELLDETNKELDTNHDTLFDAHSDLLSRYQDYVDEEDEEDDEETDDDNNNDDDDNNITVKPDNWDSLSELDKELCIFENEYE